MRRLFSVSALGLVMTLGVMLGMSEPAQAATYTCADVPGSITGDATVGSAGTACTISTAVTATGELTVLGSTINAQGLAGANGVTITGSGAVNLTGTASSSNGSITIDGTTVTTKAVTASDAGISITTTSGALTTTALTGGGSQDLILNSATNISATTVTSGGSFGATTTNGTIDITGAVNTNEGSNGGNVLLMASGNIATGSIKTNGGATSGLVEIDANTGGGSALFTIGGSGQSNGVNGSINVSSTTAGGNNNDFCYQGIFIVNGTSASTGGITVTAASNFNVSASASRAGFIDLVAQNGTLTLPTGTVSANGASGQMAGTVQLLANTITTVSGTVVSATQTAAATGSTHTALLVATTINAAGTSGLQVLGDGNGVSASLLSGAALLPKGAITITSNHDLDDLVVTSDYSNELNTDSPMTVAGASAPIVVSANGNYAQVDVSGYPITFTNGAVTLRSKGSYNHEVLIQYTGSFIGSNGLTMSGNGAVTLDASGVASGDYGGIVQIEVDQASITASGALAIHADGVGIGDGGSVYFEPSKVVALSSPTATISANNGNGLVDFAPGSTAGAATISSPTFTMTANGSSSGSNNGGYVYFFTGPASVTSTNFDLSANGSTSGTGNGGTVEVFSTPLTFGSSSKGLLTANGPGTGTGNGGNVSLYPGTSNVILGNAAGQFSLSATSGSTGGNGGVVTVEPFNPGNITVESGAVNVSVLGTSGEGGKIFLTGNPNVTFMGTSLALSANGGSSMGDGGEIHILGQGAIKIGTGANAVKLSAIAPGSGNGGTIEIGYPSSLTINTADLLVSSAGNGNGGTVNLHDLGLLTLTGNIQANGSGTGNGGNITVSQTSDETLTISSSMLLANSGATSGNGGTIQVTSGGSLAITASSISVQAEGNGNGGTVNGTATAGTLTLTGTLSAEGQGSGLGGHIQLSGNTVSLGTSTIDASAGPSGIFVGDDPLGPNIGVTSTTALTLPSGLNLRAIGGAAASNSLSGVINISSQGNITTSAIVDVHNSGSNGSGGVIKLTAGSAGASGTLAISAGQVTASALTSPGKGGLIFLNYNDPVGSDEVTIAGLVQADRVDASSGVTGSGEVYITNSAASNVGALIGGTLSADFGYINVNTPASPTVTAKLSGAGQIIGSIEIPGTATSGASEVTIDMGTGSITIGSITTPAGGDVNITTTASGGNIISDGSGTINASTLELQSGGNIGSLSGQALLTAVQTMTVKANTSTGGGVSINNTNASGQNLVLNSNAAASTSFQLVTNNSLSLSTVSAGLDSGMVTHNGNLSLTANGDEITIAASSGVYSYGGSLSILSNSGATELSIGKNTGMGAFGTTASPGIVNIAMGTPTGLVPFAGSACFSLTMGSLMPDVGPAAFTAICPVNKGTVLGSNMTLYGAYADSITFQGGVTITASTSP